MKKGYELITRGDEVFLLTEDTDTISLPRAVGILAMSVYGNMLNLKESDSDTERKRLEKKILFQSKVLNAMSNACQVTHQVR